MITPKQLFTKHQPRSLKEITELTDNIPHISTLIRQQYNYAMYSMLIKFGVNKTKQSKLL